MERKHWNYIRLGGTVLIALVAIHGATSRDWQRLHTLGVVLSALAVLGSEL